LPESFDLSFALPSFELDWTLVTATLAAGATGSVTVAGGVTTGAGAGVTGAGVEELFLSESPFLASSLPLPSPFLQELVDGVLVVGAVVVTVGAGVVVVAIASVTVGAVTTTALDFRASLPLESLPFESLPFESLPFESLPFESLPFESLPFESLPFESLPFESLPFESLPFESLPADGVAAGIGDAFFVSPLFPSPWESPPPLVVVDLSLSVFDRSFVVGAGVAWCGGSTAGCGVG
jgi:hypothetical protein